jgi:metallo-beta-lactamase family protein
MQDCGHLLEEDAAFKRKRHNREGRKSPRPVEPLYTSDDALACFDLFAPVKYKQVIKMGRDVEVTFCNAGHILGSSVIKVKFPLNGETRTILFSGDVGRNARPIIRDPAVLKEADYILIESTYGDRIHETIEDTRTKLADVVNSAIAAGGNIIVPSFAIERSQEILYYLNELHLEKLIPPLRIFLDSPMAVRVTDVFKHHPEMFDDEMTDHMKHHESPFDFPGLKMVRSTRESKDIIKIKDTVMIIAGSGMCTGGRIKHHLVNHIWRPENIVLFVGYQAVGTLGRQIVEGAEEVRILGKTYQVKARIVQALGFSAHADKNELIEWLSGLKRAPKHIFVIHGETNAAHYFAKYITEQKGWNASVPHYNETVKLD